MGGVCTPSVQREEAPPRRRSQLLQPAVHVPLAALTGPGATLEAKPPQVLPEVLVVHGPVGLRFTL